MHDPAVFDFTPTLRGETITLRPLTPEDFEAVYAAAADPLIWEQHPFPLRYQRDVFESGFWVSAIESEGGARGDRQGVRQSCRFFAVL